VLIGTAFYSFIPCQRILFHNFSAKITFLNRALFSHSQLSLGEEFVVVQDKNLALLAQLMSHLVGTFSFSLSL
jgi:hypothetical protein